MPPGRFASFPALLRDLRRATRLTQEELAERAHVGVRTLRDLEAGRTSRPQRSTVDLLATALDLDDNERSHFLAASRGRPPTSLADREEATAARPWVRLRPASRLIGRDEAIEGVASLLDVVDLVSLVGLSGIGKASLAVAVGHHVADRFPGGVGGVSVTEASAESEILSAVAACLGLAREDDLWARPASRPALLVMFGVDRHPSAALEALVRLRSHESHLRILVTSLHPLKLAGEHEWPVLPLEVPPATASGPEVFSYPATALFLDRLRRVRSRPVELAESRTLGALVRRLGGVPFALELAAARGRVLELEEMLARYGGVEADPAGQSLRDAVLASWRLLAPAEQECLCWLAVFPSRWSVKLAEALLAESGPTGTGPGLAGSGLSGPGLAVTGAGSNGAVAGDVAALVDRLVGLGLVSARPDPHEPRFWLLDAVRSVALEQAAERGILLAARDRHAAITAGRPPATKDA